MLYYEGKLYHREGAIVDAKTGKAIAGGFGKGGAAVPQTSHLLCTANGYVYGARSGKGTRGKPSPLTVQIFTVDGKRVAENQLPPIQGAPPRWTYSATFTFDRSAIYYRAMEHLVKVQKSGG
jgi:hypothetical protein